jgi:DNA-binding Lrp family transcriptional regulator
VDKETRTILGLASGDMGLVSEPFDVWARRAGVSPDRFIEVLTIALTGGAVRRFGAVLAPRESGMMANAMVAWEVGGDRAERAGKIMARFGSVSHCYLRQAAPDWPYTLYTMVHAKNDDILDETIRQIASDTGITSYVVMRTLRRFKKTSPDYLGRQDGDT